MTAATQGDRDGGKPMPDGEDEGQTQSPAVVEHFTEAERVARGKAARAEVPRASHATLEPSPDRDPVGVLDGQAASRVPELVPIRYGRMLVVTVHVLSRGGGDHGYDLGPRRAPASKCSSAAMPISPTSAASPRPSARSCST